MFKNIALGLVLTSISAGLVYGAVIRTEARSEVGAAVGGQYANNGGRGTDRGASDDLDTDDENYSNNRGNQGGSGAGSQNDRGNGNSRGAGGSGPIALEQSLADVDEVYQYDGIVDEVNADYMTVDNTDGSQILIENRAWWYALEAGFSVSSGDELSITGFYDDDGVFEVISLENLTQAIIVQVRDESGRPLWAGNGNR